MDSSVTFKTHILRKCRITMLNVYKIIKICKSVTEKVCSILVMGLVMSHLDYNNVVLEGLPRFEINRMQRVQFFAAKVVLDEVKY